MSTLVLNSQHIAAGGYMADYGGISCPIRYNDILHENLAVRHGAGLFDMSYYQLIGVDFGLGYKLLDSVSPSDINELRYGASCNVIICKDDGTVLDYFVTYPLFGCLIMSLNPLRAAKTLQFLREKSEHEIPFSEHSEVLLSIHGPDAKEMLRSIKAHTSLLYAKPFECGSYMLSGIPVAACATTELGEKGYYLFVPRLSAESVWLKLIGKTATPCGLVAYETLRIEERIKKFGNELSENISPVEAGLAHELKTSFSADNVANSSFFCNNYELIYLKSDIKCIFAPGQILFIDGLPKGEITSGTTSPKYAGSFAMAMIPRGLSGVFSVGYRSKVREVERID